MLARLQKFITLGLLTFVGGWALTALQSGRPAWAVGGLAIVLAGYTGFMAFEFIVMAVLHRDDPAPRPRLGQIARAWWAEVTTSPAVFCWQQPFRSHVHADYLPSTGGARAVVLVHGYVCNRGFWSPWMRRLQGTGHAFVAVNRLLAANREVFWVKTGAAGTLYFDEFESRWDLEFVEVSQPPYQFVFRHVECQYFGDGRFFQGQQFIQRFCLRDCSWKSIENNS